MVTYSEEVKKEYYPHTAQSVTTGTNQWINPQNVISQSDSYAECKVGLSSRSKLDITFSPISDFNIKEAYLKVSCYATSTKPYLYMYDSTENTTLHSCAFSTSKTLVTSRKDVASFINLEEDTTFRLTVVGSSSATAYIYSVYLELIGEDLSGNNKTIYLGANNIQNIYLGNNNISSVYLGDSLIYGN